MELDLTGCKIHRLLVLNKTNIKNGTTIYLCRCDCGEEKLVRSYDLTSGTVKSCGCFRRENLAKAKLKIKSEYPDIVGMRFGRLLVLDKSNIKTGRYYQYLCLCNCGTVKLILYSRLMCGNTKSCGCLKQENLVTAKARRFNLMDLSGQRFGHLLAVERTEIKSCCSYKYRCICDCGTEQLISSAYLRTGKKTSCSNKCKSLL